jgi:hypothetical protein
MHLKFRKVKLHIMKYDYDNIDTSITYEYNDLPDKNSGQCDNCGKSHFKSKVASGKFIRECSNCGMKKLI